MRDLLSESWGEQIMYKKYIQHGIDLYLECWKKKLVLKHKEQNAKYKARKSFSCPLGNTPAMKVYIQEICLLRKSSHNFQSLRRFCVYWKRSWIFKKDTLFEINIIHLIYHICHYSLIDSLGTAETMPVENITIIFDDL